MFALLLATSSAGPSAPGHGRVIPKVCPTTKVTCAAEGAFCTADRTFSQGAVNPLTANDCNGLSTCSLCADSSLVCHDQLCIPRTQEVGQTCNNGKLGHCKFPLNCVAQPFGPNICSDPNADQADPIQYLARGEACNFNNPGKRVECAGSNVCLPSGKCDLPGPYGETSEPHDVFICYNSDIDCAYGEYCDFSRPFQHIGNNHGLCKPVLTAAQKAGGFPCSQDEQCGHGWWCKKKNPSDTSSGLDLLRVCKQLFRATEGQVCSTGDCADGLWCDSGYCNKPDTNLVGEGCVDDIECGRGLACVCPPFGGGRARCELSSAVTSAFKLTTEIKEQLASYACLDKNSCKLAQNWPNWLKGSCAWKSCRPAAKPTLVNTCVYTNPFTAYKGVDLESSASLLGVATSFVFIFITLMLN